MFKTPGPTLLACLGLGLVASHADAQRAAPRRLVFPLRAAHAGPSAKTDVYFAAMQADMIEAYPTVGANADGSDLWPCVGGGGTDCPTLGNPTITMPDNAIVTGWPGYGWTLQNTANRGNGTGCDALIDGTGNGGVPYKPCAQLTTWYDDNTNDSTDDLLWRVRVVQHGTIVYDTGTFDFGPAGPSVSYPVHVLLSNDVNFGPWPGAGTGPNNGNCSGDLNYPLTAPAFPGGYYEVESNKSCAEPVAGRANAITETILATPTYRQVHGKACTDHGVASPCYVTDWTTKYEIHQNFSFLLQ